MVRPTQRRGLDARDQALLYVTREFGESPQRILADCIVNQLSARTVRNEVVATTAVSTVPQAISTTASSAG